MGSVLLIFFSFFMLSYYVSLRSDVRYHFHIKTMFGSSLPSAMEDSCLIYIICICFRIMVSNTHYVVFLFFFILCTYVSNFSGLSFLITPSLFSNVYLISLYVRSISYDICFPCCKGLLPTDKLLSRARVAQ